MNKSQVSGQDRIMNTINALIAGPTPDMYIHVIKMWTTLLETPNFQLKPPHLNLLFEHLLPLVLDPKNRRPALIALKRTVPFLQSVDYRENAKYKEFMERSIKELMPSLKRQIDEIPEWAEIWCLYLTVVRRDMARSIQINAFLSVAESGFRSPSTELRTHSFVCWRKLIEVFAAEGQLQYTKRVRLITVPLQTTASKNVDLAIAKFDCWWYLMNSISPGVSEDHDKCFSYFLNFCFGPLSDVPLDGYARGASAVSPGKLYAELKLTVVVALIRLIGEMHPAVKTLKLGHPMDDLKPKFEPVKLFVKFSRPVIYCCAEATMLVYSNYLASDMEAAVTKNIWENLFAMIKQDDMIVKSTILTMDTVKALVNLSKDPQRKGLVAALPIIFECATELKAALKGAQMVTEVCQIIAGGLNAASTVVEKSTMEKCFQDLIVSNFKSMILLDNKMNFAAEMAKEMMKDMHKCTFLMWTLIWSRLLCNLEKSLPVHTDFLKHGLENHFNEMIQERDLWIFKWNVLPKNQYLNSVAMLFKEAAKDQAASLHVVEVVSFIFQSMDRKFDKQSAPYGIFKLFNTQLERFLSTEFAAPFLESLVMFLKETNVDQFIVLLGDLEATVAALKTCPKAMTANEHYITLRKLLKDKCGHLEKNPNEMCRSFLASHRSWMNEPTTTQTTSSKMAPPPKKRDDEFVPIVRDWMFNPKELTEHQIEKLKERRDDIPALYNDNSLSQDTRSLQAWTPKTTPIAAAVAAADSKDTSSKPQPSAFAAALPAKEQSPQTSAPSSTDIATDAENNVPANDLNNSRSGTPTQRKKSRAQSELSRLTIDTVEGHSVFDKKTRLSRRGSLEPESKTSPKKSSSSDHQAAAKRGTPDKVKSRRNTLNGEMRKERTLEPVPEGENEKTPKANALKQKVAAVDRISEEVVAESPSVPKQAKVAPAKEVVAQPVTEIVKGPEAAEKPMETPKTPQPVTPVPAADVKPMVEIPKAMLARQENKAARPLNVPAAVKGAVAEIVSDTEPMTEILPVVVQEVPATTTSTGEPMDVGSESFVEEMNLVVSANNSVQQQRSIVSSPEDLENGNERESTFLNDTINISPILKDVTHSKDTVSLARELGTKATEAKVAEVLTTPKRSTEPAAACKENNPTAISTTPHTFFAKMSNGRGAQMLQQTKLFQESTPKEKARGDEAEKAMVLTKEDTVARMLTKTAPSNRSSPSTSILRRKRLDDDMDDTYESPAAKRKKVSFSDPPVSATKEFERDYERKSAKAIQFRGLMRKSRTDSASELNNLHIVSDSEEDVVELAAGGENLATPSDDGKVIEYLHKKYAPNKVPAADGAAQAAVPPKLAVSQIRKLTDVLLQSVAANEAAKEEFFQKLMLTLPKDSLHWAVKENSSGACLNEVKDQMSTAAFNGLIINQIKSDGNLSAALGQDIGRRLDSDQKLKFIASVVGVDPLNSV